MRKQLTPDELVGWAVKSARDYRGLDQSDLAREIGVHRNTIGAIERGEGAKRQTLLAIAQVLRWPAEWLTSPLLPDDIRDELGGYPEPMAA